MDNTSAAWRVGLLWFSQRQCGLVEDSHLLTPCVCMHMCVRAGPYRASEPKAPGGGALVGGGFLGGRQEGIRLSSVENCLVEVGEWL